MGIVDSLHGNKFKETFGRFQISDRIVETKFTRNRTAKVEMIDKNETKRREMVTDEEALKGGDYERTYTCNRP